MIYSNLFRPLSLFHQRNPSHDRKGVEIHLLTRPAWIVLTAPLPYGRGSFSAGETMTEALISI